MDIIILLIGAIYIIGKCIAEDLPDRHPINNKELYDRDTLAGISIEERMRLKKQDRYK